MQKSAGVARTRGSRPIFWRIVEIHRLIGAGTCPSAARLAERLNVSPRTVLRDIECLRDLLRAPVAYDRRQGGYRYDGPFALPRMSLTTGEPTVLRSASGSWPTWPAPPWPATRTGSCKSSPSCWGTRSAWTWTAQ